jgi:hypothetical protein
VSFLVVGPAAPAGASKLFTIDFDQDDVNDIDGTDDLPFAFVGSTAGTAPTTDCSDFNGVLSGGSPFTAGTQGDACGYIRAVDITQIDKAALEATVDMYVDFSLSTPPGSLPDPTSFFSWDILIVDVVVAAGSLSIDEIGIGVGTDPLGLNPLGGGYFDDCVTGAEEGCTGLDRDFPGTNGFPINFALNGQPTYQAGDIGIQPGLYIDNPPPGPGPEDFGFPGAALFQFDKLGDPANGNMLDGGEVSRRLFVAWLDTGEGTPLSRIDQVAKFMISAGLNQDFSVDIVPEPGTAALMALGVALLAAASRRRLR